MSDIPESAMRVARSLIRHGDSYIRAMVENNFDVAVEMQEEIARAMHEYAKPFIADAYERGARAALEYCDRAGVMFVEETGNVDDLLKEVMK